MYTYSQTMRHGTRTHTKYVTDDELVRIYEGEPVVEVIQDGTRWKQL